MFSSDWFVVAAEVVLSSDYRGCRGPRQPLTFFASPKKVSKERRPLGRSPLRGFPAPAGTNREGKTTRCAQTFFPSFSDLYLPSPATLKRNFLSGSLRFAWGLAFGFAFSLKLIGPSSRRMPGSSVVCHSVQTLERI